MRGLETACLCSMRIMVRHPAATNQPTLCRIDLAEYMLERVRNDAALVGVCALLFSCTPSVPQQSKVGRQPSMVHVFPVLNGMSGMAHTVNHETPIGRRQISFLGS